MIKGALYIVATPIGNLEDFSRRAENVLANVDLIMAEDTRHSQRLLHRFNITTEVRTYRDHNERQETPFLIRQLQAGTSIALIADAGTPLICDPGYHLVRAAHTAQIRVIPVPGATALMSALSVAGFSADKFVFEGFIPEKQIARRRCFERLKDESRTLVFYEVPHRIIDSLADAVGCFGEARPAVLAKEITKLHENIRRGGLGTLLDWLESDAPLSKGEFVVVIQGQEAIAPDELEARRILKILLAKYTLKEAVALTAEITRIRKNRVYSLAMALKSEK